MAKLSARGRTELARVEVRDDSPDVDVEWRRTTRALMSDACVLEKLDVHFRATGLSGAHTHSYGWKVRARYTKKLDGAAVGSWVAKYEAAGWQRAVARGA